MAQPLFGIVPAGLPVLTAPTETPSPTSFIYALPADKAFSHVVVFLLPGVALPPGTAAAIYLVTPPTTPGQTTPTSRFLGGIGPGKESAVFKIGGGGGGGGSASASASASASTGTATPTAVGVSVEEAGSVAARMEELRVAQPARLTPGAEGGGPNAGNNGPSTLVLAQRIIQNAFNFLASYSSGSSGEVVPLRAFEEWWRKFESRVRSDPTFLERVAE